MDGNVSKTNFFVFYDCFYNFFLFQRNEKHYGAKKGECNLDTQMLPKDTSVFPAHGPIRMPAGSDAVKA